VTFPTWRDWLFSTKAFSASMLALYIALALDLPRPYWAMTTVYVVAHPLSGATSSKALYRTLGTLLGAAASVVFVPALVSAPELLSLVVSLWMAALVYIALLHRTPRSYVFLLAGYTFPLIALPVVSAPSTMFDVAVARSEEIILGILCASIVGTTIFPTSIGPVFGTRIADWLRDAGRWTEEVLRGEGDDVATPLNRQRLAADVAVLDMMIGQLAHDADARDTVRWARELRGRLLLLLPVLSSLTDRFQAVKAERGALPPELDALAADIALWIKSGGGAEAGQPERFRGRLAALEPGQDVIHDWDALLLTSLLARLREVIDLWQDCLGLQQQIALGGRAGWRKPALRHRPVMGTARHYDHTMLLFAAGSTGLATLAMSLLWIFSGWTAGANFVALGAVACAFFAGLDRPAPPMVTMFTWCGVSLVVSAAYLFAIFPLVHDFEMLVLVLAPPFLLLGAFIPRPELSLITLLLAANSAGFLAVQGRFATSFASYVNGGLAILGGVLFAWGWTVVTRPFGAEIAARRLVRAGWKDLADTAAGSGIHDHAILASRTLDRLGQLVPRLASDETRDVAAIDGLAELRVGYNILELQRDRRVLAGDAKAGVNRVLAGVSAVFRHRLATGKATEAPALLLADIDRALDATIGQGTGRAAHSALLALVGLRRAFFPLVPGPAHGGPSAANQHLVPATLSAAE